MNSSKAEQADMEQRQHLAAVWEFPWPLMEVMIAGKSAIDLHALSVTSLEDANLFLKNYGFDLDCPSDAQQVHAVMIEAMHFFERYLMPKEWRAGVRPPPCLLSCLDPRQLLLWASQNSAELEGQRLQAWSCALLKLMHTISHLDDLQRLSKLYEAQKQIMSRFQKALFRDSQGQLWLGDQDAAIALERIDWKPYKTRPSMILKLLHKPANVAETIYDLLGLRIVTKHLSDCLQVVKLLRQFHLVDFANIHPARCRNTLIDLEVFQSQLEALRQQLLAGQLSLEAFEAGVQKLAAPISRHHSNNPHSSDHYRAIQLTCRQRIRYLDPRLSWQNKLEVSLNAQEQAKTDEEKLLWRVLRFSQLWQESQRHKEISAFFPFEVQIMDASSAQESSQGAASHGRYKSAQVRTARRRLLTKLLDLYQKS